MLEGDTNNDQAPADLERPPGEANRHYQDDDDDDDEASVLTEIFPDDIPSYFSEHNGRLYVKNTDTFHSHGNLGVYPLPVDTPEQERFIIQHFCIRKVIGANYIGPVPEVLAHNPDGRLKRALDLATGTGHWVLDMASEFPGVRFNGLDVVPIATRYPPDNVWFEIHDINERLRWDNGAIDLVHARSICMAIRDPNSIVAEVARVLRPGGLFLWNEWVRALTFHPDRNVQNAEAAAPGLARFWDVIYHALYGCHGIQPLHERMLDLVEQSGQFQDIERREYYVPIGPWQMDEGMRKIGRVMRAVLRRYADSYKPLLLRVGHTEDNLEEIRAGFEHDLRTVPGLVAVYSALCARKI